MEEIAPRDLRVTKLLSSMRTDLERIANEEEQLPSRIMNGWAWYFLRENPERLDEKYPHLLQRYAELGSLCDHATMESHLKSRA